MTTITTIYHIDAALLIIHRTEMSTGRLINAIVDNCEISELQKNLSWAIIINHSHIGGYSSRSNTH